jgi:hypothetical protein
MAPELQRDTIPSEVLLPVGEQFGEVLLVVCHAGLLREQENKQQLQERQVADPLAVNKIILEKYPIYYSTYISLFLSRIKNGHTFKGTVA